MAITTEQQSNYLSTRALDRDSIFADPRSMSTYFHMLAVDPNMAASMFHHEHVALQQLNPSGETTVHTSVDSKYLKEAIKYSEALPGKIVEASKELLAGSNSSGSHDATSPSIKEVHDQIYTTPGLFDEIGIARILQSLETLPESSSAFREYVLERLVPQLGAVMALRMQGKDSENNVDAVHTAINRFIDGYNIGKLSVISAICPPYEYELYGRKLSASTPTRHTTGKMLPTIGKGYEFSAQVTANILGEYALHLPDNSVIYTIMTYSGSKGKRGLWEVAKDTMDYYSEQKAGEMQLQQTLASMHADLTRQTTQAFKNTKVIAHTKSLEYEFVPNLERAYNDFLIAFPGLSILQRNSSLFTDVDAFLRQHPLFGVGADWLMYFYQQALDFAKMTGIDADYNMLQSGLRDGLIYLAIHKLAAQSGKLIWGLEHTANWMVGSLPYTRESLGDLAIMMLRPYNPINKYSFRQPWNTPVDNTVGSRR